MPLKRLLQTRHSNLDSTVGHAGVQLRHDHPVTAQVENFSERRYYPKHKVWQYFFIFSLPYLCLRTKYGSRSHEQQFILLGVTHGNRTGEN